VKTSFFLTIPSVLKTVGSIHGQEAATAVKRLAPTISTIVVRAIGRCVFRRCQLIHSHAAITAAMASRVTQRWA
jgi:hypothetical protein